MSEVADGTPCHVIIPGASAYVLAKAIERSAPIPLVSFTYLPFGGQSSIAGPDYRWRLQGGINRIQPKDTRRFEKFVGDYGRWAVEFIMDSLPQHLDGKIIIIDYLSSGASAACLYDLLEVSNCELFGF